MASIPDDLDKVLSKIDDEMKAEGIAPVHRAFHGTFRFARKFKLPISLSPMSLAAVRMMPDTAQYELLRERIAEWFVAMYGEGQHQNTAPHDHIAVFAQGDMWRMRFDIIFGDVSVGVGHTPTGARRVFDAVENLEGITPARMARISAADRKEVVEAFMRGELARASLYHWIEAHPIFREVRNDWHTSTTFLSGPQFAYGQSRWASLQMAEKFMKGILFCMGAYPRDTVINCGHNLKALHKLLEEQVAGLNLKSLTRKIECGSGMRYAEGGSEATRDKAYRAHKAALDLIGQLGQLHNPNHDKE